MQHCDFTNGGGQEMSLKNDLESSPTDDAMQKTGRRVMTLKFKIEVSFASTGNNLPSIDFELQLVSNKNVYHQNTRRSKKVDQFAFNDN